MFYDYKCDTCNYVREVRQAMRDSGSTHVCITCGNTMQRLYGTTEQIVALSAPDYVEKAYRGEERVPGLSVSAIRARVDGDVRRAHRGRSNRRNYGDRR